MLKELIGILLTVIMMVILVACGEDAVRNEETEVQTTEGTVMTITTEQEEATGGDMSDSVEEVTTVESTAAETTEERSETAVPDTESGGKILVAYFSWSGNTEEMANHIAQQTGADLYEIEPETPYSEVYDEVGEVAKTERDENARPQIGNLPESLDEYDTILIGYPIWWHTAPMIIGTFLESYDLSGKDVYPFTQSASMDTEQFENSMDFVRTSAGNATVHDGLFVDETDTAGIDAYLTENGLMQ